MPASLGLRVLCIDDDAAIRESMAELLTGEGYDVTIGATVNEGLSLLRQGSFHLLVTDYALPDGTGTQLILRARAEHMLKATEAIIITAHPDPEPVAGVRLFRKPLDVDHLLRSIWELLAPAREAELAAASASMRQRNGQEPQMDGPRIEFILYVSAASASSLKAVRNMQRLLAGYDPGQVAFSVCDLSRESPPSVVEDRIAFTPTLVKRRPEPRAWVLGDLENIRFVADLLHHSGVERKR